MYIDNALLDILIETIRIEYHGCHCPHRDTPLYGRAAYWHVYVGDTYYSKITTSVKSLEPKPETLKKLFRAELKKRIEAIHERCTTNHYGAVYFESRDPYSMRSLLEAVFTTTGSRYIDIHFKNTETMKRLRGVG